jgi:hypothetical protein
MVVGRAMINADNFIVRDAHSLSVPGQNEKDIWVDPKSGHEYIAKKPGRNGRTETLTEYLLNLIGLRLGLRMAEPQLAKRNGELRFMSKKFHGQEQMLLHGHEFFAQFYSLEEMRALSHNSQEERRIYSIVNVIEGFRAAYMHEADRFIRPFMKMVFFDAAVGCQDRHLKNWGILRSVKGQMPDHFAPVFDTARGLFWEYPTARLKMFSEIDEERYARRSRPPITDFSRRRVTHFALVSQILYRYPQFGPMLQHMVSVAKEQAVLDLLEARLGSDLPKTRKRHIRHCLCRRFGALRQICASNQLKAKQGAKTE